jgi:hypothetical protein
MAENKTTPTTSSVTAFLDKIQDNQLRDDCVAILAMMQKVSRSKPLRKIFAMAWKQGQRRVRDG